MFEKLQNNTFEQSDSKYAEGIRAYWGSISRDFNPNNIKELTSFFIEQSDNFNKLNSLKTLDDLKQWPKDVIENYGDGLPMRNDFFAYSLYLENQGYSEEDKEKGGAKEIMDNRRDIFLQTVQKLFPDVKFEYLTKDLVSFLKTIGEGENNSSTGVM